ncbi:MAG: TIGR03067 domain-containing protein [Bacteroidota bacterium]
MVIDGNWQAVEAQLGGNQIDEEFLSVITLSIAKDQCEIHIGGNADKGTLKFIPHVVPMAFDFTSVEGPNKGKTYKSIYKLTGGYLIICFNTEGPDRPKTFLSTAENHLHLVRYKRAE